ncbi:hypothetical protein R1flu_014358 [Riccia fluitans]|uniref:DNA-binding protein RHL1 n=1 Tax=Riccia fluitans TaxID=41844 RepID=A0ABD1YG01_9MARC
MYEDDFQSFSERPPPASWQTLNPRFKYKACVLKKGNSYDCSHFNRTLLPAMVKAKKFKEEIGLSAEDKAAALESKRLRDLALSEGVLARTKSNSLVPLPPSITLRKCKGKDIVKKGNRKTKYLFVFPGLVAPLAGGKFGELTRLDSRNPVMYMDFPQGRLKLFGTIVYPKNKYLTMHFFPGKGDIKCEDCFESLVVFAESWWIGTKDENPEELRLPFPKGPIPGQVQKVNFNGGAGQLDEVTPTRTVKVAVRKRVSSSPASEITEDNQEESDSPVESENE